MPTPPPSPVSFQCRLCTLGTWRDKGGNPMRKRPRQHVNFMYERVEQMHCEKWKFSTARIFIILAFNLVFKCVQIFIYLNIAILFNLQCTTQLSLWHAPLPMEIVFFTTGCFLLTILQQLHRFLNSYRTWELLTHKKMWNQELEVAKLRLQYSRSRPTVRFGHFGRCWKVVGFFSMHPRKVRHRCFGIGRAPKIFIFDKAIISDCSSP